MLQRRALRALGFLFVLLGVWSSVVVAQEQSGGLNLHGIREEKVFPVDWLDSGLLVLNNGERVVLSGVFVPSLRYISTESGKQEFFDFWQVLRARVLSKIVRLYSYETTRDRYRIRYGDLYLGNYGEWLQSWLVSMGWSWTLPSPWSSERNRVLLLAERDARSAGRGFWGTGDFKQVTSSHLLGRDGFVMLRDRVSEIDHSLKGWVLKVGGVEVFVPTEGYIASPSVGDLIEVRGSIFWRDGVGRMRLRSHRQLLDENGLQWYERHGSG